MRITKFLFLFVSSTFLQSCFIQNQAVLTEKDSPIPEPARSQLLAAVNPPPILDGKKASWGDESNDRALGQSEKHKVLVALVGTGIDYVHPRLAPHVHFQVDKEGLRTGWDFIGNDGAPSPYVANTEAHSSAVKPDVKLLAVLKQKQSQEAVLTLPHFKDFLDPRRDIDDEIRGATYIDTGHAGIIASADRAVGISSYRVYPLNRTRNGSRLDTIEEYEKVQEEVYSNVLQAIKKAIEDGAQIVLSAIFPPSPNEIFKGVATSQIEFWSELAKLTQSAPDHFFVIPVQNEGRWFIFPKTLDPKKAENVLFVGTSENGQLSGKSNFPINYSSLFILAPGSNISTWAPWNMCLDEKTYCKNRGRMQLSGTATSASVVAKLAAKLYLEKKPESGAELRERIFARAEELHLGGSIKILNIPEKEVAPLDVTK